MATALTFTQGSLRLDNMRVTYGGTDMGVTSGGVEINVELGIEEQTVDQYGIAPVQTYDKGKRVTIKIGFAEATIANLGKFLYGTTTRVTGGTAVGIGLLKAGTKLGSAVGVAMILHPLDKDDSSGLDRDINAWKVVPITPPVLKTGSAYVWEVTFLCLPDTTKTDKEYIDFGLTAATA